MKRDVVIVGGGPGGSAAAMFLLREGVKPLIIEAESFPRYHIGESMTGAAGQVMRELGFEEEMIKRRYPLKQGVNVYGQSNQGSWWVPVAGRDPDWNLFDWNTWQVRRSDFDKMMLDEAVARGAELLMGKAMTPIMKSDGSVGGVKVRAADGGTLDIQSQMLLDCSGQATWLANLGGVTGPKYLGAYDKQIAIFSQVRGAIREDGGTRREHPDNTLIFYQKKFHWAWSIPIEADVVSVGVVIPSAYFLEQKETPRQFLTRELHQLHPELTRRIPEVDFVEDVHVIPNYSFQVKNFMGRGFMCIGDSHRFIDPIFSFGLTVTMREGQMAAPLIRRYLAGEGRDAENPFAEHQLVCEKGIDVLEDALDCFWEQPLAFGMFVHNRYTNYMPDLFAGRIYEDGRQPSPAVDACRKMLGRTGERERSYEKMNEDLYSIPIGSRYHPERAPIWEVGSAVETTESWLGPR